MTIISIKNKTIKKIIKILPKTFAVGSYARNSHLDEYKDLDLITLTDLDTLINIFKTNKNFSNVIIKRQGLKHVSLIINNNQIDIWKTDIDSFWKTYMIHYLPKHAVIAINKKLM